ncbi:MAG: serine protease [Bacteroidetes bacterium]|nr:serine protease [Bacteroidota bacterium]
MSGRWCGAALVVLFAIATPCMRGQDIVAMLKMVKPAVVTVIPQNAFGLDDGHGTGFFISRKHLVTNYHVIDDASSVKLRFKDSAEVQVLRIVAQDSAADLAILEVVLPDSIKFTPIKFKTTPPEQGERVYVVGNPLEYDQSVSDGIVSSVRVVKDHGKMIQFTAAISGGNSGSPLLDGYGNALGVASAGIHGGQNLNFAVPAERVQALSLTGNYEFKPTMKEYDGVMMNVRDAFEVDTSLIGKPPDSLSIKDQNQWKIRTAGQRFRWPVDVVDKNMNRLLRGVKRNYPKFDLEVDTLSMSQARSVVGEMLGYNKDGIVYPEEIQAKLSMIGTGLEYASASLITAGAMPTATFAGTILKRAQIWQEFEKNTHYAVITMADTSAIEDVDVAIFRYVDGAWKVIASDTDDDARPVVGFEAPETDEYAIVWRVARRSKKDEEGVFGSIVVGKESR